MNINQFSFILMIIIFTLFIINLSNCNNIEYFQSENIEKEQKFMKIDRNEDLINRYRKYNEDLKYLMHIHFDYYVKDTNKPYARYITQLDRNRSYYEEKLKTLKYPFVIRKESDGYYIDYQLPERMVNNKVEDISWEDFNDPSKILITLYDAPDDFIKQISDLLKSYDNIEYQYSNSKVDMLYDSYIYTRRVLTDIDKTLTPLGKQIISDLQLDYKLEKIKTEIPNIGQNIEQNIKQNIDQNVDRNIVNILNVKLGKDFTDYLKNQLKPYLELQIKTQTQTQTQTQIDNGLQDKITVKLDEKLDEKIKDITPYINQESLKFLNKINTSYIQMITNNSYVELALETRDYRYIYVYDKNDPEAPSELLNLVKFLKDVENLDYVSDYYIKNLRYYRVPINIMRVLIKFGEYLKLF